MPLTNPYEVTIPTSAEDELAGKVAGDDEGVWEDDTVSDDDEIDEQQEELNNEEETVDDDDTDDADDNNDNDNEEETSDDDAEDEDVRAVVENLQTEADAAAEFLATKDINYNELVEEYQEYGKLTKQTIADLAKAGISEKLVEGYIQGQQARMDIYASRVKNIAGGEAEYDKLMKWAAKNLSERDIRHYDKAVESHDIEEARYAVENLMARRKAKEGEPPQLLRGRTSKSASSNSIKGFSSLEEMAQAMDDPRYEHDAAYTRRVEARMLASDF